MGTLHMETDAVRTMVGQIKQISETMRSQAQSLNSSALSLDWLGGSHDEFVMETEAIARQLNTHVDTGITLAGRVEAEVTEWENAAASFGMTAGQLQSFYQHILQQFFSPFLILQSLFKPRPLYETRISTDQKPENMQQLAKSIGDLYDTNPHTPIRVIKIGENEYLVLVTGTQPGGEAHNWNSAIRSGMDSPSDYEQQLKTVLMGLPAGAIVNLAGHSQGGIISNNVVTDKDIQNRLKIRSVTTFGSPVSAEPQTNIGPDGSNVIYTRYAARGDVVPLLSHEALDVVGAIGVNPLDTNKIGKEAGDLHQHMIGQWDWKHFWDVGTPHSSYFSSDELKGEKLPFEIKNWESSDYFYSKYSSNQLPGVDKKLF